LAKKRTNEKVEIRKNINSDVPDYSRSWNWTGNTYLFEPQCGDLILTEIIAKGRM